MGFGNDAFGNDTAAQDDANDGAGWADAFGEGTSGVDRERYHLNFARTELTEVLNSSTPGSKQKAAGLGVSAAINYNADKNELQLELQFSNQTAGSLGEFDLMINKNSFGVGPDGPCSKHGIAYPAPF